MDYKFYVPIRSSFFKLFKELHNYTDDEAASRHYIEEIGVMEFLSQFEYREQTFWTWIELKPNMMIKFVDKITYDKNLIKLTDDVKKKRETTQNASQDAKVEGSETIA